VVRYNDRARDIILGFKHSDRTERANPLAEWMARAGAEVLNGADCLVPVPLHRRRLWARQYNQAAMLALAISKVADIPVIPDALVRVRRTAPQAALAVSKDVETSPAPSPWGPPGHQPFRTSGSS
jgi:predicted amidophosphoribosyltransferase